MFNSQCSILSRRTARTRAASLCSDKIRIRIEHWELNIGQIPIGHSAKLFCASPIYAGFLCVFVPLCLCVPPSFVSGLTTSNAAAYSPVCAPIKLQEKDYEATVVFSACLRGFGLRHVWFPRTKPAGPAAPGRRSLRQQRGSGHNAVPACCSRRQGQQRPDGRAARRRESGTI